MTTKKKHVTSSECYRKMSFKRDFIFYFFKYREFADFGELKKGALASACFCTYLFISQYQSIRFLIKLYFCQVSKRFGTFRYLMFGLVALFNG